MTTPLAILPHLSSDSFLHLQRSGGERGDPTWPGASIKAPQEADVWQWKLPGLTQAGAAASLAMALKTDTSLNHQKSGRPPIM
jgi:hypothetical protein